MLGGGGITTVILVQVLIFGLLPLLVVASASPGAYRQVFRLRPVSGKTLLKAALMAVLGWIVVQGMSLVPLYLVTRYGGNPPNPYQTILEQPLPGWVILLVMAAMPALTEEFAFRGLVLSGYEELGPTRAWVWAGLVFGLAHMSLIRLPGLVALGMLLAFTALRTGSIWPTVLMHALHNGITLVLFLLTRNTLQEEAFNLVVPAGTVLTWLAAALAVLPLLVAVARSLPKRPEEGQPGQPAQPALGDALSRWWPLGAAMILYIYFVAGELTVTFGQGTSGAGSP